MKSNILVNGKELPIVEIGIEHETVEELRDLLTASKTALNDIMTMFDPGESEAPPAQGEAPAAPAKRVRRTKEQIAADEAAAKVVPAAPPPVPVPAAPPPVPVPVVPAAAPPDLIELNPGIPSFLDRTSSKPGINPPAFVSPPIGKLAVPVSDKLKTLMAETPGYSVTLTEWLAIVTPEEKAHGKVALVTKGCTPEEAVSIARTSTDAQLAYYAAALGVKA